MSIGNKLAWSKNKEEKIKKHLEVHKGRKLSEEARKKISEARKIRDFKNLIRPKSLTGQKYIQPRGDKFQVSIRGENFKFNKVCDTLENAIEARDTFIKTII